MALITHHRIDPSFLFVVAPIPIDRSPAIPPNAPVDTFSLSAILGREVGAAAGVAVLGSLVSAGHNFVAGFRVAMIVSGVIYIIGTVLAVRFLPGNNTLASFDREQ